jgi:hypothetical protein
MQTAQNVQTLQLTVLHARQTQILIYTTVSVPQLVRATTIKMTRFFVVLSAMQVVQYARIQRFVFRVIQAICFRLVAVFLPA